MGPGPTLCIWVWAYLCPSVPICAINLLSDWHLLPSWLSWSVNLHWSPHSYFSNLIITTSTTTNLTLLYTSIPKFSGNNSISFKDLEVFFQLDGTWDVVSGVEVRLRDEGAAAAWDNKDKHGYSLPYFLISPDYHSAITKLSSGYIAWKTLKSEYKKDSSATCLTLQNQFYTVCHDPSKTISIFIESVQSISWQLKSIGHAPGKNEVEDVILLCLNPMFEPICSSLIAHEKEPVIAEIISAIKECK